MKSSTALVVKAMSFMAYFMVRSPQTGRLQTKVLYSLDVNTEMYMIGIWSAYASTFLHFVAIGTVTLFGLPLLLWPLHWAKVLHWRIPDHTDLTVYFGRCLGALICAMGIFAFLANSSIILQIFYFDLIMTIFMLMILVHIYGAIKRIQPVSETYEIIYWIILLVLSLLFYPI